MSQLGKWKLLKSETIINHRWCKVRRDEIELPNGKVIDDFFVHIKPDVALVLATTPNKEIVFVRQYRHAMEDFFYRTSSGRI